MTKSNTDKHLLSLFCLLILIISPNWAHAQFIPADVPYEETEDLGNGLYAFRQFAYRSIFVVTDEGVILTDPVNTAFAKSYRQAIAAVTDQPVKYVIYTHSHWDHISGGQIFKDEGAQFVAQEKCLANLKESTRPDVVLPDITFKDHYKIEMAGRGMEAFYFGPMHDNCISVIIPRPANMIHIVDLVTPPSGWYMSFDILLPDFYLFNAPQYMQAVEDLAAREGIDTIIGGHLLIVENDEGKRVASPSTGSISAVSERRVFWQMVLDAVKEELDKGANPLTVHEKVNLTPFESARGYNEENMRIMLRRVSSYYVTGR